MDALAIFETNQPGRYLEQLCHHFGRKVRAQCDTNSGWVAFPFGRCEMTAGPRQLTLHASADDRKKLDDVVRLVTSHLERFAFRENPMLEWQAPST